MYYLNYVKGEIQVIPVHAMKVS